MSVNGLELVEPGAGHHDLDRPELGADLRDRVVDGGAVGDVGRDPERARTRGAQVGGGPADGVAVEVEQRDPVPDAGEALRHGESHPCCGARHYGDPAHSRLLARARSTRVWSIRE